MFPNIEAERARKGWSRAEFAKQIGVSESTLKNWMHGKTGIPADKVIRMAELFDCSTDYLLNLKRDR